MRVNGEEMLLGGACTLSEFLEREGYCTGRIAVELNGAVVPKSCYDTQILSEDDRLEIVTFVGGG